MCKYRHSHNGIIVQCDLIGVGVAGPDAPYSVCTQCESQWIGNQEPTAPTPILVELLSTMRGEHNCSRGLGDTIAKFTHATGIDRVVHAVVGGDCGCKKRQDALNKLIPYKPENG